jgi:methionine-rich copper-binding protein CopC
MRISKTSLAAILAATAVLGTTPAAAHTRLVSSTPAANAKVQAPATITLTFNEPVVPAFSKVELTMPAHRMKVPITTTVSPDGRRIVGTPKAPLAKGAYAIHWTAAGADGHKMEGRLTFTVN